MLTMRWTVVATHGYSGSMAKLVKRRSMWYLEGGQDEVGAMAIVLCRNNMGLVGFIGVIAVTSTCTMIGSVSGKAVSGTQGLLSQKESSVCKEGKGETRVEKDADEFAEAGT
ncbi:predicted protein [Plenodomus lingam JN3]|uniref:Predicted protein n=1 Tax=Leptosphaeria maculans (strain JN3 / isolate v23.1.3 / race Av1-4-5-6-7-8) TaxID=985895 RepID=E4ZPC3_LEPMJ|nr:predicted protein [Plenodomus lingam JN3]CBX93148.1 predicted protein [Plenodomus lingam JN3]